MLQIKYRSWISPFSLKHTTLQLHKKPYRNIKGIMNGLTFEALFLWGPRGENRILYSRNLLCQGILWVLESPARPASSSQIRHMWIEINRYYLWVLTCKATMSSGGMFLLEMRWLAVSAKRVKREPCRNESAEASCATRSITAPSTVCNTSTK